MPSLHAWIPEELDATEIGARVIRFDQEEVSPFIAGRALPPIEKILRVEYIRSGTDTIGDPMRRGEIVLYGAPDDDLVAQAARMIWLDVSTQTDERVVEARG